MSNDQTNGITGDTVSVFISLVTKSIESSTGLSTKVDGIAETQKRQDSKLDGLMITMAEVRQSTSNLGQKVDSLDTKINDHEIRLRALEPEVNATQDYKRRVEKLETQYEDTEKAVDDINNKITRYVAVAGTALLVAQFFISTFVVPWAQQVFFGG